MSSIHSIYLALDILGAMITLIIFLGCMGDTREKDTHDGAFIGYLILLLLVLISDGLCHALDGNESLRLLTYLANTVSDCAEYVLFVFFMRYLAQRLYQRRREISHLIWVLGVLCALSVAMSIANLWCEFHFTVDGGGAYVRGAYPWVSRIFPLLCLFTAAVTIAINPSLSGKDRAIFFCYPLFPLTGLLLDYFVLGASCVYIGVLISTVIMYTNTYSKKRRMIVEQRTALMVSQINPHFMYNTLTTIASLCELDPPRAKQITLEFSSFLRQNLNTLTTNQLIPFEQELHHVDCYLKIEKARFGDKINAVYDIQTENFSIPALTIQPLVENAVRYGLSAKAEGGTIKLSSYSTEDSYIVEVKDDGVGFDMEEAVFDGKKHVGIANVRTRLMDMCGGSLTVKSMVGIGTRVVAEIPCKKKGRGK
ncbi:MAG: histidine kinase [Clostridia bacterium]|nr:histidine kinase [Clostridia bacterium]